jgi:hypothetical protein
MMVNPRLLKGCDAQIVRKIMSNWILTLPLFVMTMVRNMVNLVKKIMGKSIEKTPVNLKESLGLDYQIRP